jgi:RNA polymerase sigma factor (sigma-70 family)
MSDRAAGPLADCVRAAVRLVTRPPDDADLLSAFVRTGDPAAFEELVLRHSPLVQSACRSILPDPADADDACQATFLVLYRKAGTIRTGQTSSGWLFRVARRAALEVQRSAQRRRECEARAARPEPVPGPDLSWREAVAILHEELDQLPDKYRLPLVLCYLEGKTQDEAARALGWPTEALRGRIDRGRAKLAQRLRYRGVTLSAGLLAAAGTASIAPAEVARRVMQAVATPSPTVRAAANALASSAGRSWAAAGVLSIGAVLLAGVAGISALSSPPASKPSADKAEPPPREVRLDLHGDPLPDGAVARLGTVQFNHGDRLAGLQFSMDGKWVLSSGGGNARVWDAETGTELRNFTTGSAAYRGIAGMTPGGQVLLPESTPYRQPLHVWDVSTGTKDRTVTLPWGDSWGTSTQFTPDARLAGRLQNGVVPVFDIGAGRLVSTLKPDGGAVAFCFAGDHLMVTVNAAHQVQTWEASTGKPIRKFDHGGPAVVLAASADGRTLATLEHHTRAIDRYLDRDVIHVWDLTTGKRKRTLAAKPKRWFMGVRLSPDGRRLAAVPWARPIAELLFWDTDTGELVHELSSVIGTILDFSPDGKRLAFGHQWGRFELLDLTAGRPLKPGDGRFTTPSAVALSPDGTRVSVTGYDSVSTWDATTGRRLTANEFPQFGSSNPIRRYSPDGKYAVTYDGEFHLGRMVVREASTGKAILTLDRCIAEAGFSRDSSLIATPHWDTNVKVGTIQVRDLRTGKVLHTISRTQADYPRSLFLSDDGDTVLACGDWVVGYSLLSGQKLFAWRMPRARVHDPMGRVIMDEKGKRVDEDARAPWRTATVSPDGRLFAGLREFEGFGSLTLPERLLICDARTGQVLHRCSDGGKGGTNSWGAVQLSPDNRLLVSSDGFKVHLWEAATGRRIRTLVGHRNEIAALAFSGNGRRLASASHDSTVLIWDLAALTPGSLDSAGWWSDLISTDPAIAYAAVWRLADAPDDTALPLFRKHLRPVTAADVDRIRNAVAELDSDQFRVRDRALKELADFGHNAGPALRAALDRKPSAEARQRIEQLLAKIPGPPSTGEPLRIWRAIAALEAKGTPGATHLLRELVEGADGAWLTHEAKAALRRVNAR